MGDGDHNGLLILKVLLLSLLLILKSGLVSFVLIYIYFINFISLYYFLIYYDDLPNYYNYLH